VIIAGTPYCPVGEGARPEPGRDYGYAINCFFERLRDDDWGFLIEHDLHWTTRTWFRRLEHAVRMKPDAGLFTVMRYPAVSSWSAPKEARPRQFDIRYHRKLGEEIAQRYKGLLKDVTDFETLESGCPTAGIFLLSKRVWAEVGGFKSGFKDEKIDYDMHCKVRATGRRCWLIRDVYFFHAKGL
jgi:GT2 family glycosyltransferase